MIEPIAEWVMPIEAVRATLILHGWVGLKEKDDDTPNYSDGARACLHSLYNMERNYRVSYNKLSRLYQMNHHAKQITMGVHWTEIPLDQITNSLLKAFYYKLLEAGKL